MSGSAKLWIGDTLYFVDDEVETAYDALQSENEALKAGMADIKDLAGDVDRAHWPAPQQQIWMIADSLLAPKSLTRQETLREVTKVFDKRKE